MIFSFSRIRIVESSLNDSTQSPGLEQERAALDHLREARPAASRASPAKTSGGLPFSRSTAAAAAAGVGPFGLLQRGEARARRRATRWRT